ncbi:hypothetical protein H4S02_013496, partial [Coemansia sp. RSA 2611]
HDFDNDRQRPGLLSFFYVENETCTGTATPYIINIPPLRYPHLPTPGDARPQMRPSVTYRSYTGAGAGNPPTGEEHDTREQDPYTYDVPGVENQGKAGSSGSGSAQQAPPPPYSPLSQQKQQQQQFQPQDAKGSLPPRTDGTYSSSYEHTAAWVQGTGSQTTGSDAGGPSHQAQQTGYAQAPPPQQQQQPPQQYSQPPPQQYSQAPAQQQYSQAPAQQPPHLQQAYSAPYSQPPYSQPVVQTQQQQPPPQSSSSHPNPQSAAQQQQQQPPQH